MRFTFSARLFPVWVFIVLIGCSANESVVPKAEPQWRSQHLNISAKLVDGWRKTHIKSKGDTYDRPDGVLAGFLNDSGPYAYIIKVEKDLPLDQLSLEDYLSANLKQYASIPVYKLIDESEVDFHGHRFHRFRFKVAGAKGPTTLYSHIFRNGHRLINVQWTFPTPNEGAIEIPDSIAKFDKDVTFTVDGSSE